MARKAAQESLMSNDSPGPSTSQLISFQEEDGSQGARDCAVHTTDGNNNGNVDSDDPGNNENLINPWKNRNVRISLVFCVVSGIADSIWCYAVLSGFLYSLGHSMQDPNNNHKDDSNTLVGLAEAVQGIAQLASALPIGVVADLYGKAKVVRIGGWLMLLTIAISLWAVSVATHSHTETQATRSYHLLLVTLASWGIVMGISNGPSQALFADSIQKGKRSHLLTWLYVCYLLASTVGPIVSIVLFLRLSKEAERWSMQEIYPVMVVGLCLEIPAAVLMWFFSDKHVVPEPEEGSPEGEVSSPDHASNDDVETPFLLDEDTETDGLPHSQKVSWGKAAIPYVLFVSSLVVSLGSGASVKYFPLFFKELGFSSAQVQGIYVAVPVSIAGFSFVAQRMSQRLGRIETTVLTNIVGTSLLFFMTWLSRDEEHLDQANKVVIVVVYLMRTGIMNSSYPLLESILMDSVPSKQRARWKSLESIAAFGWTGSALAGGILADERSYRFTFAITASMQLFGGFLLLPIQPFVESETTTTEKNDPVMNGGQLVNHEDSLREPLLASDS